MKYMCGLNVTINPLSAKMTGMHDMKTCSALCLKAKPQVSEIEQK